jgi:hypothetical protein
VGDAACPAIQGRVPAESGAVNITTSASRMCIIAVIYITPVVFMRQFVAPCVVMSVCAFPLVCLVATVPSVCVRLSNCYMRLMLVGQANQQQRLEDEERNREMWAVAGVNRSVRIK